MAKKNLTPDDRARIRELIEQLQRDVREAIELIEKRLGKS
jgi:hypothetical protein